MNDRTVPDSALAVTLGAATVSGLAAGLGVWVATPRQLRLLSYGLFAGTSVALVVILIIVGVAVDDDLAYLDAEHLLLLEQA